MKRIARALIGDSFFRDSALIFASNAFVNVFNLLFWLFMVRRLSFEDYGALNALVSLLLLFSVPLTVLQTVVTRYVSRFAASDKKEEIKAVLFHLAKILLLFLSVLLLSGFTGHAWLIRFLRLKAGGVFLILGAGIIFSSFSALTLGALTGLQRFQEVAANNVFASVLKLGLGVFLVLAGWRVAGALLGFVFSFFGVFLLSLFQLPRWVRLRDVRRAGIPLDTREILEYALPVGLGMISFFLLTNADIILVKHFFPALEAGYYSAAQIVGKVVLFVPGAITVVMLPKVVDSHARHQSTRKILKKSIVTTGTLCGLAVLFVFIFPQFVLGVLTGQAHPQSVELVDLFALSMSFFALVNVFIFYNLSLHRKGYIVSVCVLACLEIGLISFFHGSLTQVLRILCAVSGLLFCFGLVSYRKEKIADRERTFA